MKYLFACLIMLPLFSFGQQQRKTEFQDYRKVIKEALTDKTNRQILVDKVIPDKQTAIAVAESILFKIYSKEQIVGEKPYRVSFVDDYWILSGTLHDGYLGGTFSIILSAKDGRVIKLTHGR